MIYKNLDDIYEAYDAFLVDVYGVIYDGRDIYNGALDALAKIKASGRPVVILSNTSLVASVCMEKYAYNNLMHGVHYDRFISSGEAFKQTIRQHIPGAESCFQIFERNYEIFMGSEITEAKSLQEADFVYVGSLDGLRNAFFIDNAHRKNGTKVLIEDVTSTDFHDLAGLEEVTEILDLCLKYDKQLVVANPDVFALKSVKMGGAIQKRPVICQGAIGELYERAGGKVLYFGKPHCAIYDFALSFLEGSSKPAMIGDTPWTDILGGNIAGIGTILTLTGVPGEFFKSMPPTISIDEKFDLLLREISPKMTHNSLRGISQQPNHVVERLAVS
ncbi:MAG: TIGR01459 family HAD-type hydrolase [Holosporales bacterium]|jgi:HAD superfamily hydrolase (TIGR01459 family)|nr:TIGR01459 family HAD-type hydrolase [Holosporales bacterium]